MEQLEHDKQSFEQTVTNGAPLDIYALKRLVATDLVQLGVYDDEVLQGFSRKSIRDMAAFPERYGKRIARLNQYMYLRSGYLQRLIDYFANLGKSNWTLHLSARGGAFPPKSAKQLERHHRNCAGYIGGLHLESEYPQIMKRVFLYDACFAYFIADGIDNYLFYLPPEYCTISAQSHGVLLYEINVAGVSNANLVRFPSELREAIKEAKDAGYTKYQVPIEKSFCVKYNDFLPALYPPFFNLILDILDIDDYKKLKKATSQQEAYRFVIMEIPLNEDGKISIDETKIAPYVNLAKAVLPPQIGVLPTPMKTSATQFKSDQSERDAVADAADQFYAEAGVSPALLGDASTVSAIQSSIVVDAASIFRLNRQIERVINVHLMAGGLATFPSYAFSFSLLDVTAFNQSDIIDKKLRLAEASVPDKFGLAAASDMTPDRLLGNEFLENTVYRLGNDWTVLKTSSTQSASDKVSGGRPEASDAEITESGEKTRENDSNNKENRL